jgi:hypothetical protein
MSGVNETGVPRGASERVTARTSVFDVPGPPPVLPPATPSAPTFQRQAEPTPMARPSVPTPTVFYRTDQDRARSVYRRANPWYRRLARGAAATALVAVVGGGLYLGARALQDYLGRDRLPAAGTTTPEIRHSSFVLVAGDPVTLEGTIDLDAVSKGFRFVGEPGGPQEGLQFASVDGSTVVMSLDDGGTWSAPAAADQATVEQIVGAIPYLVGVEGPDDLLGNRMRDFVELVEQTTEGLGSSALVRYEMHVDTLAFATANPLSWVSFGQEAIPGVDEADDVPVTMWLDDSDVVVRLRDGDGEWSWQRLSYSDAPFEVDPTGAVRAALGS